MTAPRPKNRPPEAAGGSFSRTFFAEAALKVRERGSSALELLLEARCFAQELNRSVWDFALEAERLRSGGLVYNDLRWLVCKGYLEHASEILSGSGEERRFHKGGALTFTKTSCFVLTEAGAEFVQQLRHPSSAPTPPSSATILQARIPLNGSASWLSHPAAWPRVVAAERVARPWWDRDRQELRLGEFVVKQFKVPAPNQEMVIAVFQEEGWPPRIDDPLPPRSDLDPKRRLHDTINSLNRNQKTPLIRFLGDGSGQGVRWEPTTPLTSKPHVP